MLLSSFVKVNIFFSQFWFGMTVRRARTRWCWRWHLLSQSWVSGYRGIGLFTCIHITAFFFVQWLTVILQTSKALFQWSLPFYEYTYAENNVITCYSVHLVVLTEYFEILFKVGELRKMFPCLPDFHALSENILSMSINTYPLQE